MAAIAMWPRVTHPPPVDPVEHVGKLFEDFQNIQAHLGSSTNKMIPQPIFHQLFQSIEELKRKMETHSAILNESSAQRGSKQQVIPKPLNSKDADDATEKDVTQSPPVMANDHKARERNDEADELTDDPTKFTIHLKDARIISLIREMAPYELRSLLCRAAGVDKNNSTAPGENPWILSATQRENGDVEVRCHSIDERQELCEMLTWQCAFEDFVDGQFPVYGVLTDDFTHNASNIYGNTCAGSIAEQLATTNMGLMFTLNDIAHVKSAFLTQKIQKAKVTQLCIRFARPEQANEAVLKGLKLNNVHHTCIREVQDKEVPQCEYCCGYGICQNRCTRPVSCQNCYGPHETKDCAGENPRCVLCKHRHKTGGKLCKVKALELQKAKEAARATRPLFEVAAAQDLSSPTMAQIGGEVIQDSSSPKSRRPSKGDGTRKINPSIGSTSKPASGSAQTNTAGLTNPTTPKKQQKDDVQRQRDIPTAPAAYRSQKFALPIRPSPLQANKSGAPLKRKASEMMPSPERDSDANRPKRPHTTQTAPDHMGREDILPAWRLHPQRAIYIGQGESMSRSIPERVPAYSPELRASSNEYHRPRFDPDRYIPDILHVVIK